MPLAFASVLIVVQKNLYIILNIVIMSLSLE